MRNYLHPKKIAVYATEEHIKNVVVPMMKAGLSVSINNKHVDKTTKAVE
jgi:ribosomal protein L9